MVRNAGIDALARGPVAEGVATGAGETRANARSEARGGPSGAPGPAHKAANAGSSARGSIRGNGRTRRTQAERVAESDSRMLEAAQELVAERGCEGTSLAAIGERSGYSRGLVHGRFGSKEGLLTALVRHILVRWDGERERPELSDGEVDAFAVLDSLVENHRRAVHRDRAIRPIYQLMFAALGPLPTLLPTFRKLHMRFRKETAAVIQAGVESGAFRSDTNVDEQAALLVAVQRGIAFQWLFDPEGFDVDGAYDELKRNLRRTLAAEKA